jgi:hypothetical protein
MLSSRTGPAGSRREFSPKWPDRQQWFKVTRRRVSRLNLMNSTERLMRLFTYRAPLTSSRVGFAFAVALVADGVQFALGPFGWVLIDQGLDVLAMALISSAIGFHMLLLPTFVIEFIPGPDMLPTWTACTAAVVMLRRRRERQAPIDIDAEVTTVDPNDAKKAATPDSPQIPPRLSQTETL